MHTKLIDEKREDYVRARVDGGISMLSAQSNRRAFDPPYVTSAIASLHVIERTAIAFPLQAHLPNMFHSNALYDNISERALTLYAKEGEARSLFFHSIATMHAPAYANENGGALLGDWPRIPLTGAKELLTHSAALGRRLAELLDPESSYQPTAEWSFLARLILPKPSDLAENLKLTAGWGSRGQGSTVMPGRGKSIARPWTEAEREKLATLAATQSLTLDEALALLGETCLDIHLNGDTFWAAVPANVWTYTLGGYQVLKKWLSYRELPLLGRPLKPEEAKYFSEVVRRIAAILLLGPALDASYAAILPTATGLPPVV